ncbi:aminopeptidase [Breznakiella homolactica]|uniref:Aminopeptidase n=1 Tax=Breznakiella homolactica TaxID=2798577 RepID=A0A7T7XM94_9SPIR|nr:aminopeptidase [Breznakiella homolactica]QQO08906.1 aminopeptidase [Breznakiella homolactica]
MDIRKGARIVIADCLGAKPGETFLVVTDPSKQNIGEALYKEALELGLTAHYLLMPETGTNGAEPTTVVSEAMKHADVIVCPTRYSLTHTNARKEAAARGARIATMPGITEDMFGAGAITADYKKVAALSDKVTEILSRGENARIEKDGKILEMSLKGRNGVSSNGLYHTPGSSGNLPTGEGYIAPLEGTANGTIIVDGSLAGFGKVTGPLEITIENGKAVSFSGPEAEWMEKTLASPEARNVAELGVGTNDMARITGVILEDEKVYGTIHVAFGSNATFGGTVSAGVHIDGIILGATLSIDGQVIVRDGKVLV